MKKKSGIILSALPLLTLGLCFISNSSFANGVNGNEVILVNSMGAQQNGRNPRCCFGWKNE